MKHLYFLSIMFFFYLGSSAQTINIPDVNLKSLLVDPFSGVADNINGNGINVDSNEDGEISVGEAAQVASLSIQYSSISSIEGLQYFTNLKYLSCNGNNIFSLAPIYNLTGMNRFYCDGNPVGSTLNTFLSNVPNLIELSCSVTGIYSLNVGNFTNLTKLRCNSNNISTLDVSNLTNLQILECSTNLLGVLNLTGLTELINLNCSYNSLITLDLSSQANLERLYCNSNQLTALNISGLTNLKSLYCGQNQISSLNPNGLGMLEVLDCSSNQLTSLDLNGLSALQQLSCNYNSIVNLDASELPALVGLYCHNNLLNTLNIKNGKNENALNFANNPTIQYVCADEDQITNVQSIILADGYTNCSVNSYCSFTPGGTFYTISGNSSYDIENNGCDASDVNFPNVRFAITNGTVSGSLISNSSGSYSIQVLEGTQTIAPVLENPAYFNITPATTSVVFPASPSPYIQNFCITPNGIHNDVEIMLLSLINATPGFNATYKIIYKNKGTQTQSGTINFAFNDAVLDFVNATPTVSSQASNVLNWSFTNLQPFETREILVTLNLNSPSEVPPVNGGDVLNFTASINISLTDETPNDNTFTLNQTVVNSYDPNDKTCLEGNTITPDLIGKEVHYMIRFENTGTANAENIVVKDMIDTEKFDINSLIPIDASHSFVTRISSTNKVEFIFENIQLPFDDANNDGYVAFKIKTKPTLVVGNSFSNTASIYFDYNFPIITNTATTAVALLANQDFAFEDYFKIYPNPAKDVLNIETKQTIGVTSINIYNTLGQIVFVIPNAQQTKIVDVSSLKSGNYFMKINSDKGSSSVKFVKL